MKSMKSETQINKVYTRAYKALEDVTPLLFDCGELCGAKCCLSGSEGMYLFPYEAEFLKGKSDKTIVTTRNGIDLLLCDGHCDRLYRPLACRIFPLFPYVTKYNKINVSFDLRAKNICPLQFTDIPEINIQNKFTRRIAKVFKKLSKYKEFNAFLLNLTDEILFLEKFY